jgi:hypothetical protein
MSSSEDNSNRNKRIYIRVTSYEKEIIEDKMKFVGIKNMSEYIRHMALFGKCHVYNFSPVVAQLKEMNYYIGSISKSINQIAKALNTTGNLHEDDFNEMKKNIEEVKSRHLEMMKACMSFKFKGKG